MRQPLWLLAIGAVSAAPVLAQQDTALTPYVEALGAHGQDPIEFVLDKLDSYDLIIFDDAIHTAFEPFEFYQELVRTPEFTQKVRYVFLELLPVNRQPHLDAYLTAETEQIELLYPAFTDATETGFSYQTYFDLLRAIRDVNQTLPESDRLQVVAVNNPVYWSEIHTPEDIALYRKSLSGRDYDMYKIILNTLGGLESGEKGVFLTNTRHAYNGIRRSDGRLYWNTGTFFHEWHPERTYSIRFHNVALIIERVREDTAAVETTEGLGRRVFRWDRMEDGLWDSAFAAFGDEPVAFPLASTPFGRDAYVGNHMLDVEPGQTMADAYDAIIFLVPLESLQRTGYHGPLFTPEFLEEMARRYRFLFTPEQLDQRIQQAGVTSVAEFVAQTYVGAPEGPLPQAASLESIDAWRER